MNEALRLALIASAVAIGITSVMDATGYTMFSALALIPITGLFWFLQKNSRAEVGLTWGTGQGYAFAILYPVLAIGLIAGIAFVTGAIDTSEAEWDKALINIAASTAIGPLMVMLTEEGFFRGWLWASFKRGGLSDTKVLIWTTVIFVVWHWSAIFLDTGFDLPLAEIPIYAVNATLLGMNWGLLRQLTGSVVVASVCHAIWNGLAYTLFGFGEKVGELGVQATHFFGPEVGLLGFVVNVAAFAVLLVWRRKLRT